MTLSSFTHNLRPLDTKMGSIGNIIHYMMGICGIKCDACRGLWFTGVTCFFMCSLGSSSHQDHVFIRIKFSPGPCAHQDQVLTRIMCSSGSSSHQDNVLIRIKCPLELCAHQDKLLCSHQGHNSINYTCTTGPYFHFINTENLQPLEQSTRNLIFLSTTLNVII